MIRKPIDIFKCKRIAIVGPSGSGKSTLAIELGEILHLPVFHIDMLFWKPNWQSVDKKVLNKMVKKLARKRKWIIDGTYTSSLPCRFKRASLVILLDYSQEFCISSVKKRFKEGVEKRVGIAADLKETDEGVEELVEIIKNFPKKRQTILQLKDKYAKHKFLSFSTREELSGFVEQLKNAQIGRKCETKP